MILSLFNFFFPPPLHEKQKRRLVCLYTHNPITWLGAGQHSCYCDDGEALFGITSLLSGLCDCSLYKYRAKPLISFLFFGVQPLLQTIYYSLVTQHHSDVWLVWFDATVDTPLPEKSTDAGWTLHHPPTNPIMLPIHGKNESRSRMEAPGNSEQVQIFINFMFKDPTVI